VKSIARRPQERERGAALVEMALVVVVLFTVVFGVIDLGRAWALQNRLSNAAHEGASIGQFKPGNVNAGCAGGNNIVDRAAAEDTGLSSSTGWSVAVAKKSGATLTPYTGCGTPVGTTVAAGDTIVVTTTANFQVMTPLMGRYLGNTIVVSRTVEVVVQG
jgi:Flp pilus assembly protein TadG